MEITEKTAQGLICVHRIQYACRAARHIVTNMKGQEKTSLRAIAAGIRYTLEVIECVLILKSLFKSEPNNSTAVKQYTEAESKRYIMGMDWADKPDPIAIVVADARDFCRAAEHHAETGDDRPLVMVRDIENARGIYFSEVVVMPPHHTKLTSYQQRRFDELVSIAHARLRPKKDLSPSTRDTWPPESEQFFNPNPRQVFTKRKK